MIKHPQLSSEFSIAIVYSHCLPPSVISCSQKSLTTTAKHDDDVDDDDDC